MFYKVQKREPENFLGLTKSLRPNSVVLPIGSIVVPFGELPWRIRSINHKKELYWSLWVVVEMNPSPNPHTRMMFIRHLGCKPETPPDIFVA